MGQKKGVHIQLVPRLLQIDGHIGGAVFRREALGVGHVGIILHSSVLGILQVVGIVHGVKLVAFSDVGAEKGAVKMGGRLVRIIAAAVKIVQLEAYPQPAVDVHGIDGPDAVFAVLLVAAFVIGDVRQRGFGIIEQQFVGLGDEEVVRPLKDELAAKHPVLPFGEETALTGRAEVAREIIVSAQAVGKSRVLEGMGQRVGQCGTHHAETAVYGPHVGPYRHIDLLHRVLFGPVGTVLVVKRRDRHLRSQTGKRTEKSYIYNKEWNLLAHNAAKILFFERIRKKPTHYDTCKRTFGRQ